MSSRWVYVAEDIGRNGEQLRSDMRSMSVGVLLAARIARRSFNPWRFGFASIAEAMKRETDARKKYKPYVGGGGREWVKANAEKVVADLTRMWGGPTKMRETDR